MHYVVDGYNFGYSASLVGQKSDDVTVIVNYIKNSSALADRGNSATVVFDGIGQDEKEARIKVLFSRSEKADDVIKRMLESLPRSQRRNYIAVTEDHALAAYCRSLGVRIIGATKFCAIGEKRRGGIAELGSDKPTTVSKEDIELAKIFEKDFLRYKGSR